jgi:hypothetical protein
MRFMNDGVFRNGDAKKPAAVWYMKERRVRAWLVETRQYFAGCNTQETEISVVAL